MTKDRVAAKKATKEGKLTLAERHLERVQESWYTPTNWDDLSLYGFYCLEAAVEAAAIRVGLTTEMIHSQKVAVARTLHRKHKLPDVSSLLADLNTARKSAAYGDVQAPELDAQDVAAEIEEYVEAVKKLIG